MEFLFSTHFLGLLLALFLVGVVHELGHAVAAPLAGYRVSSVGFGHTPAFFSPLLRIRYGETLCFVGLHWWAGGRCVVVPASPKLSRLWLYCLGGVLAQLVLGGVLLLPFWPSEWARSAFVLNAFVLVFNLLPWRVGGAQSDGWGALRAWCSWGGAAMAPADPDLLKRIWRHERSVGATLGQEWCQVALARCAMNAGAGQSQAVFLGAMEELNDPDMEGMRLCASASWHSLEGRPLAALRVCREARQRLGLELGERVSGLLYLAEARSLLELDEAKRAREILSMVAGASDVVAQEALVVSVEVALLERHHDRLERGARRLSKQLSQPFLNARRALLVLQRSIDMLESDGRTGTGAELSRALRRHMDRVGIHPQELKVLLKAKEGLPISGNQSGGEA